LRYNHRKSSQGLSAGSIIAIIIPSVVALIVVGIIAMMCSRKSAVAQPIYNASNSNSGLAIQ